MSGLVMNTLITWVYYIAIDVVWLMIINRKYYQDFFARFNGGVASQGISTQSAIYGGLAWLCLAAGMETFVLQNARDLQDAVIKGALFGMIVYGVYDFTNLATLSGWTFNFAVADIVWGSALGSIIAYLRYRK